MKRIIALSVVALALAGCSAKTVGNILSANDASFEGGTGTWGTGSYGLNNATIAQTTAQALDGTHSLAITSTATSSVKAPTGGGTLGYPVGPNTAYTAILSARAATTWRALYVSINWSNASGTYLSSSDGSPVTDITTGWTQGHVTATSPSTAAFAQIVAIYVTSAISEVHYVDEVALNLGTSTTWVPGGRGDA